MDFLSKIEICAKNQKSDFLSKIDLFVKNCIYLSNKYVFSSKIEYFFKNDFLSKIEYFSKMIFWQKLNISFEINGLKYIAKNEFFVKNWIFRQK